MHNTVKNLLDIENNIKLHLNELNIINNPKIVAVSKTFKIDKILPLIEHGHADYGENKVQELVSKYENLPKNIRWHMIGHLQRNKVKYIAPFVHMIHGVDSAKLLKEIDKQGKKNNRKINCLIQIKIAEEVSKFGFDKDTAHQLFCSNYRTDYPSINICGIMGMATFTNNKEQIKKDISFTLSTFNSIL